MPDESFLLMLPWLALVNAPLHHKHRLSYPAYDLDENLTFIFNKAISPASTSSDRKYL